MAIKSKKAQSPKQRGAKKMAPLAAEDDVIDASFTEKSAEDSAKKMPPLASDTASSPLSSLKVAMIFVSCLALISLMLSGFLAFDMKRHNQAQEAAFASFIKKSKETGITELEAAIAPLIAANEAQEQRLLRQQEQIANLSATIADLDMIDELRSASDSMIAADRLIAVMMWQALHNRKQMAHFATLIALVPDEAQQGALRDVLQSYAAIDAPSLREDGTLILGEAALTTTAQRQELADKEGGSALVKALIGFVSKVVRVESVTPKDTSAPITPTPADIAPKTTDKPHRLMTEADMYQAISALKGADAQSWQERYHALGELEEVLLSRISHTLSDKVPSP